MQTDEQLDAFVREHAETAFHPSCSCKMGEDEMAVVDGQGRVHGMEGLRVVDASIMPLIITGNLNATTIMIAEKLADRIRQRARCRAAPPTITSPAMRRCASCNRHALAVEGRAAVASNPSPYALPQGEGNSLYSLSHHAAGSEIA